MARDFGPIWPVSLPVCSPVRLPGLLVPARLVSHAPWPSRQSCYYRYRLRYRWLNYQSVWLALVPSTMPWADDWQVVLTPGCLLRGRYKVQTIRQCLWSQPDVKTCATSARFRRNDPWTTQRCPSCSLRPTTVILLNTSVTRFSFKSVPQKFKVLTKYLTVKHFICAFFTLVIVFYPLY